MINKRTYTIFYSWQSDSNPKYNNYFIKDCLERVVKHLSKDAELKILPRIDKDTENRTGSPNIVDSIFQKIDTSQIMVADVTLTNSSILDRWLGRRLTPNPNVLLELGYAVNRLSWDRVICLNNSELSKVEDLPFDLKLQRVSKYRYSKTYPKEKAMKELYDLFHNAIRKIIENYDLIEEKQTASNQLSHDKKVFSVLNDLIKDSEFLDRLELIDYNNRLKDEDYRIFYDIESFLEAEENQFLISEIKVSALDFLKKLEKMHTTFARNFYSYPKKWNDPDSGEAKTSFTYTFTEKLEPEDKKRIIGENVLTINDTIESYKAFRKAVKKNLFI